MKKWTNDPVNPAGKIQCNRVNKAISAISWEHNTTRTLSGIIGKKQTPGGPYEPDCEHEMCSSILCGGGTRPDVLKVQEEIGERYNWTVTKDNAKNVIADLEAALPALIAARPTKDERETQEQHDERVKQDAIEREQSENTRALRDKAVRDAFEAQYGEPGTLVQVPTGAQAVCARLCFDNSDSMSDYSDSHATLGVPLLLAITYGKAQTEAVARAVVSRFPELAAMEFDWKTEKWSMGHGNYLTSNGVDVPEAIGNERKPSRGGDRVTTGHWEIQFVSASRYEGKDGFSVFKGYSNAPQPAASGPVASQGGALGTVAKNEAHNGVEIAFTEKPSDELRSQLKRAGFRITRRPPWKWYQRYSEAAFLKACELAGVSPNAKAEQPDPAGALVEAQEAAYEDAQAQAIGA